jgi:hypothetical protein
MHNMRAIALLSAMLVLATASAPDAKAQTGAIEGVARAEDSGAPVQFALVRLLLADSSRRSDSPPQGITNASGRYRFDDVAPGWYRVQLLRIGFRPVLSDPVEVARGGGATVQADLRVASLPVLLPTVTITPEACVTATELAQHPQIQTLWQQARDGASVRAELMARFRYRVQTHEESAKRADGTVGFVDRSYLSDPRSAARNAAARRSQRLSRGYYGPTTKDGVGFYTADELDVLHEDFLKEHCLLAAAQHGIGEVGLRFRPRRVRRNLLDVGGTIWLDSATFLARRIELEYVDGYDERGTVRLDFSDVAVAGGTLRMPVGGEINLRPSRTDPAWRTETRLTITYSDFVEVRPR